MKDPIYRLAVAAVVRRWDGDILVCKRTDAVHCWQFPQGGIERGESPEEALQRELREEISLNPSDYAIRRRHGPYRYLFPGGRMKKGAHGQEQTYFLLDLLADETAVNVETPKPEFSAIQWVRPSRFDLGWLPPMKVEVYRAVLQEFFGVKL